ncbi:flavin reductase (DIM6/NTAB) family NADH-FMN oxidoreductase RutF [Streptomyces griseochromogenes]|uniref:Flavin reductase (DIM6/NTAB) family NADH-FMN oxidoreductase RutF n=2 Tax=Streptomyces griseochromogenes TaxID=68214 RepID=A0ABS4LQV1_9ACTN|nr:flavin reductase family protein [Streptomyces griseochromogenes]MBP2049785.1 flavin reductase (DIM6/NTAB) family NADH-FMN oxidoreductase RutF [Streptomyces griseochromogenes]
MAHSDQASVTGLATPAGRVPSDGLDRNAELDRDGMRRVLGRFTTGVTVVTTGGTTPHGMTANSFTSVSLSPPLVLICVLRGAAMHEAVLDRKSFAVSVLSARQEDLARYFADRRRPRGIAQFAPIEWSPGRFTGSPVVADALAWLECSLTATHDGGDHSIFVGEVLDMGFREDHDALLFHDGGFHSLRTDEA